eukprot:gnl/TRDRNA2_/TRDRNA2_185139_c0_seq1.p1 gnl/TRDRNA2_/TRDRNA2_185139_c0~~gnl/TRDRNA2_/TRDRNA2_185139_c0_seq1.p1  ORF type:complete len:193 (+),score=40.66 gnl/TRDRNA2_/TRDRNA2_185139_c0_seq1:118-696(+)
MEDDDNQSFARAVAPGQRLGDTDEVLAGKGTYAEGGHIYASVSGELTQSDDSTMEVVPNGSESGRCLPEVGSTVVARVLRMTKERADCRVVAVGDVPLDEKFHGVIRKQDIRFFEVDKLEIQDAFRVGDFVRAQVLSLGDARSYVLSTALSDHLGVVLARSAAGGLLEPISWNYMRCPKTGGKEKRKVARPI